MFVKSTRVKSGGRVLTYLQLVESYRNGDRVRQRMIKKLGREDELDPATIERLIRSLAKYADVEVGAANTLSETALLPGHAFGHLRALEHVWNELDLNAKDALHTLESIQGVTINLGTASIERTSTPNAEQASILAALKAEAAPNTHAYWQHSIRVRHRRESPIKMLKLGLTKLAFATVMTFCA
jgi:hypothetical protein